jgi:hypothetical protein
VTFFNDAAARTKRLEMYSMRSLATRINAVTAARKASLPWLKLARFGDLRSDKGSLRYDANVIAISGIEADYDNGAVTVDEACEPLIKQGVAAVVYTSPSHTEDAPRWRVLCPLSEEMPPDRRESMVGRLNGLFRGILAAESFTLSQSYYYGSVDRSPSHRVEIIEGLPIDLHDDLDLTWLGKVGNSTITCATNAGKELRDDAELIRCAVTGEHLHVELCALAARYVGRSIPWETVEAILRGIMLSHAEATRDERWQDRYDSIPELVASAGRKYMGKANAQLDPRRKAIASAAFRLLRQRKAADELVRELHRLNAQQSRPLPTGDVNATAIWCARQYVRQRDA